jgi:hypothetical protein
MSTMNGCLRVLLVLGVVVVLGIGALVFFGVSLWNRYGPSVQQFVALPQQIERALPDLGGVGVNFRDLNGRRTVSLEARVPFDPTSAPRAPQVANRILEIVRSQMPKDLPVQRLEVRLYREQNGGRQEKVFSFDLTDPKPIPVPRGSS